MAKEKRNQSNGDGREKLELKKLRELLAEQQLLLKEHRLPVLILLEGWSGAGKGAVLSRVVKSLDPRFYHVYAKSKTTEGEERRPYLWRYFTKIPEAGKIVLMDSGWMEDSVRALLSGSLDNEDYAARLTSIMAFERQLAVNGYLLFKIFLNISEKEQGKRLDLLREDKNTRWRVNEEDLWQNKHYDKTKKELERFMERTNVPFAPWHVVDGTDIRQAELAVLKLLTGGIDGAVKGAAVRPQPLEEAFPMKKAGLLVEVDLGKALSEKEYEVRLKSGQERLRELHNRIYRKKVPVVIVYEGWDAAGKGGNIKRLAGALDARGYEVVPIAAPEPHEKSRHYLWRFWTHLPKTGHVTVFDRSWYGRVMVERVEGLCSQEEWRRAYQEINEFEKELTDWGAVVVKFWLHIDPETQLERFTERQNTPEKRWKLTDEDWRNREKWPAYEAAVDEMLAKTSTQFAPWHIIESNDKKFARVKAIETVIAAIERAVG